MPEPSARLTRVIVTDIDGTLCFSTHLHGIVKFAERADGLAQVRDPDGGEHLAHDVSYAPYETYLSKTTADLLRELRKRFFIILASGARRSTMESRRSALSFFDHVILESGGMIFDSELREDPVWRARLTPHQGALKLLADDLKKDGWRLDDRGREFALRVRPEDNPGRSLDDLALRLGAELAPELRLTSNMGYLDVIIKDAGKANALRYLLEHMGVRPERAVSIGDDVNDLEFLSLTGESYVLGSAFPEALDQAMKKGWHISKGRHFSGINEILRDIGKNPG